jgi:two-component sensor histidine kinase
VGLRAVAPSLTHSVLAVEPHPVDRDLRHSTLRAGAWIGWISILVVVVGLSLRASPPHLWLLLALTIAAAGANALAMRAPWRDWLAARRGRVLLDLWCGALIGFIAVFVLLGGSSFTLLPFLALPFIAVAQVGWRRLFWLVTSFATCALVALSASLPVAATAMRLSLVAAVVAFALVLARTIRRQSEAGRLAAADAELGRALASEANHRIKNSLQSVADLLLLARPESGERETFDETAMRIRSIAAVHRLLSEQHGAPVLAETLLESIASSASSEISLEADRAMLEPGSAQKLGMVANELIANALRHGTPPIAVRLSNGVDLRLTVEDGGHIGAGDRAGLGLRLVHRLVEQGLGGRFELRRRRGGGTCAEVVIPGASG